MSRAFEIDIKNPCPVAWETMQGNDQVRFCSQCKLNVHNLSAMTDSDVQKILSSGVGMCVQIRKKPDGTIVTDNCPYRLRRLRNSIRRWTPWVLFVLSFFWHELAAQAQAGDAFAPCGTGTGGYIDNGGRFNTGAQQFGAAPYTPMPEVLRTPTPRATFDWGLYALSMTTVLLWLFDWWILRQARRRVLLLSRAGMCALQTERILRNALLCVIISAIAVPALVLLLATILRMPSM